MATLQFPIQQSVDSVIEVLLELKLN